MCLTALATVLMFPMMSSVVESPTQSFKKSQLVHLETSVPQVARVMRGGATLQGAFVCTVRVSSQLTVFRSGEVTSDWGSPANDAREARGRKAWVKQTESVRGRIKFNPATVKHRVQVSRCHTVQRSSVVKLVESSWRVLFKLGRAMATDAMLFLRQKSDK